MPDVVTENFRRAVTSLDGLSIGDAFGQSFFVSETGANRRIQRRETIPPRWPFTDDTMMSLSIVASLGLFGEIDSDWLASSFAEHYDYARGYGPAMHRLLRAIASGEPWREVSFRQFDGQGSLGNGSAMRAAPIGAYFAHDMDVVIVNAERSSLVTHSHPDGVAGAIAVSVAAALATHSLLGKHALDAETFLTEVAEYTPAGAVKTGIVSARELGTQASIHLAVKALGNGIGMTAADTVPFAIWNAAKSLNDFEAALWSTVAGLGDRDTTCAIVGGIVASSAPPHTVPQSWRQMRESLPDWYGLGLYPSVG